MSEKTLTLTIFGKKRKAKDGHVFQTYFTELPNGERVPVKFRMECGEPNTCPVNIDLRQDGCNLSSEKFTRRVFDNLIDDETGEVVGTTEAEEEKVSKVLWISAWAFSEVEYRDSSMDEFF